MVCDFVFLDASKAIERKTVFDLKLVARSLSFSQLQAVVAVNQLTSYLTQGTERILSSRELSTWEDRLKKKLPPALEVISHIYSRGQPTQVHSARSADSERSCPLGLG